MEIAALRGEAIDVRRPGVLVSGVAAGVIAELVGEDVDEVGALGGLRRSADRRGGAREESSPGGGHLPDHLRRTLERGTASALLGGVHADRVVVAWARLEEDRYMNRRSFIGQVPLWAVATGAGIEGLLGQ